MHNSDKPILVEVFAGRGTLSRAMVQAGFSVLSVDHENNGAVVPLMMLDLTSSSGVKVLWDILSSPNVAAVHLGLPCGTASLARERPVAKNLVLQGAPNPPPLRSASKPLGLDGLSPFHQAKVDSANKLYALAIQILVFCVRRNIAFSIENPANSWLCHGVQQFGESCFPCMLPWVVETQKHCLAGDKRSFLFTCSILPRRS